VGWRKAIVISSRVGLAYPFFINNLTLYLFSVIFYLLKNLVQSYARCFRTISQNIKTLVEIKC